MINVTESENAIMEGELNRKVIPITRAESLIPRGEYCYEQLKQSDDDTPRFKHFKPCPFHSVDHSRPTQENGHCRYLNKGDWELDSGMLWDFVKECTVKLPEDL